MKFFVRIILWCFCVHQFCHHSCFAVYSRLRCTFSGNSNNLDYLIYDQTSINDARFSTTDPDPCKMNNTVRSIEDMKAQLDYALKTLVSNDDYNTLDSMLSFYGKYQKYISEHLHSLDTLFDEFDPIADHQDVIKQTLGVIREMKALFRNTIHYLYVATVWDNFDMTRIDRIRNLGQVPSYFQHNQVAGVLRFENEGRLGYYYMSTELEMVRSEIVYDDEQNQGFLYTKIYKGKQKTDQILLKCLNSLGNHAPVSMLANSTLKYILIKGPNNTLSLAYVGKPYCSFIETTSKVQLLTKERKLIRRNMAGKKLASLIIDLFPQDGAYFHFIIHKQSRQKYQFERASLSNWKDVIQTPFFNQFSKIFNSPKSKLENVLQRYDGLIRDQPFLQFYQKLIHEKQITRQIRPPIPSAEVRWPSSQPINTNRNEDKQTQLEITSASPEFQSLKAGILTSNKRGKEKVQPYFELPPQKKLQTSRIVNWASTMPQSELREQTKYLGGSSTSARRGSSNIYTLPKATQQLPDNYHARQPYWRGGGRSYTKPPSTNPYGYKSLRDHLYGTQQERCSHSSRTGRIHRENQMQPASGVLTHRPPQDRERFSQNSPRTRSEQLPNRGHGTSSRTCIQTTSQNSLLPLLSERSQDEIIEQMKSQENDSPSQRGRTSSYLKG